MGMGSINPVENVLFFDKKGKTRAFNSDQLKQVLPREVNSETLFFVSRREEKDVLTEARDCFLKWSKITCKGRNGLNFRVVE